MRWAAAAAGALALAFAACGSTPNHSHKAEQIESESHLLDVQHITVDGTVYRCITYAGRGLWCERLAP